MSPLPPGVRLAPLRACHAAAVFAVQRAIYPSRLLESAAHIVARADVFPSGSFVALMVRSGGSCVDAAAPEDVVGYAQAYPWPAAAAAAAPPSLCDGDAPAVIARACAAAAAAAAASAEGAAAAAASAEGAVGETLLFVHEVSVWRQGVGLGRALMEACLAAGRAAGLRRAMLVAVLGNAPIWARFGFASLRSLPAYGGEGAPPEEGAGKDAAPWLEPTPSQASADETAVVMVAAL